MRPHDLGHIWVYLEASPLLGLTLTVVIYLFAERFANVVRGFPLAHPVLVSIVALVTILELTHTPYPRYFEGAQFVHFLLGPATVALALPLYRNLQAVRRSALAVVIAVIAGSLTATLSATYVARALGASALVVRSLAPKSVTTPIAMAISEQIGGIPSLTAALVILTGITGAVVATWLAVPGTDWRARGLGMGTAAHGIGTARALALDLGAGAFSSVGLGFNAVVTAIAVPLLNRWLHW